LTSKAGRSMKKQLTILNILLFTSLLVGTVKAENESFVEQFIGSPLLILVAIIIIDIIAFAYHKLRK